MGNHVSLDPAFYLDEDPESGWTLLGTGGEELVSVDPTDDQQDTNAPSTDSKDESPPDGSNEDAQKCENNDTGEMEPADDEPAPDTNEEDEDDRKLFAKRKKDYEETLKAVKAGVEHKKVSLAWYKLSGVGGAEIDEEGAVALLKECDRYYEAMWMLGICYEYGIGCEQDIDKAESLYEECSEENEMGKFFNVTKKWRERGCLDSMQNVYISLAHYYKLFYIAPWSSMRFACFHGLRIRTEEAQILFDALKTNERLTDLNMDFNSIEGMPPAVTLGKALKVNTTLQSLNISLLRGDEQSAPIIEALKTNSGLTTLVINYSNISDHGARLIYKALKRNSTLTSLELPLNSIGDEGAFWMGELLIRNSTLTTLKMSENRVCAEGAKMIAESLEYNTTLTELSLGQNSIETQGALFLSEQLKFNSSLSSLDVGNDGIELEGVLGLEEALKTNTTLTRLRLIGNSGEKEYQKLHPDYSHRIP